MLTAIIWFSIAFIFIGVLALGISWVENTKTGHRFIRSIGKMFFDTDLDKMED